MEGHAFEKKRRDDRSRKEGDQEAVGGGEELQVAACSDER